MQLNRQQIIFEKTLTSECRSLHIALSEEPFSIDGNTILLGCPMSDESMCPDTPTSEYALRTPGHFAVIRMTDQAVELTSDICGGYRLYYAHSNGTLHISDNYEWLAGRIGLDKLTTNEHEERYWQRHGYTTGAATLLNGICKLPPASVTTIDDGNFARYSYLPDDDNDPSVSDHDAHIESALLECCASLRLQPNPVILLFSGGADSCLLAQMLKLTEVSFDAVTLALNPAYPENAADCERARRSAAGTRGDGRFWHRRHHSD